MKSEGTVCNPNVKSLQPYSYPNLCCVSFKGAFPKFYTLNQFTNYGDKWSASENSHITFSVTLNHIWEITLRKSLWLSYHEFGDYKFVTESLHSRIEALSIKDLGMMTKSENISVSAAKFLFLKISHKSPNFTDVHFTKSLKFVLNEQPYMSKNWSCLL